MAVSKRLRYEILRRDNHACRYCGATAPDVKLTIDHVTPTALGGTDTPDNLVTACSDCNSGKSSVPADAPVVAAAQEHDQQFRAAIATTAGDDRARQEFADAFLAAWTDARELPPGWAKTIDAYRKGGLAPHMWDEIVTIAMERPSITDRFRYCCGIARRKVEDLQDRAKARFSTVATDAQPTLDALGKAAVDAWISNWTADHGEPPSAETLAEFTRSVQEVRAHPDVLGPQRLIAAAEIGGSEQQPTINKSLGMLIEQEHADIVIDWADAWCRLGGDSPDDFLYTVVHSQVRKLRDRGVSLALIQRAAVLAGYFHSTELHHGLRQAHLEYTNVTAWREMAADIWTRGFHVTAKRWPEPEERGAFMNALRSATSAAPLHVADLLAAASAASTYEDPDISTCLLVGGSVFETAAALPTVD